MRPRHLLISGIATAFFTLSVITNVAVGESAKAVPAIDKQAALSVRVAKVEKQPLRTMVTASGTVAAWRELIIGSEANGLAIVEVLADEGDKVTKGQVLARINSSVIAAQIEQQKAAILEAEATLERALAQKNRAQQLSGGAMSKDAVEERETAAKTAAAKLAAANALLSEQQAKMAQTSVSAPADGYVSKRSVVLGQVVQAGTELFRIVQDSRLEVDACVPETDLYSIESGQDAIVTGPTNQTIAGRVRMSAPIVDAKTRLGTVRIALPANSGLKPGMFARVQISTGTRLQFAVPQKALVWSEGKPGVFIVSDIETVTLRMVETGLITSSHIEITGGLKDGERIVVEGAGLLNDGDKIRVDTASLSEGGAAQ